jgi:hypothetical protein
MLALWFTLPSRLSCPEEQQEAFHARRTARIAEPADDQGLAAMTILQCVAGGARQTILASRVTQIVTGCPKGAAGRPGL